MMKWRHREDKFPDIEKLLHHAVALLCTCIDGSDCAWQEWHCQVRKMHHRLCLSMQASSSIAITLRMYREASAGQPELRSLAARQQVHDHGAGYLVGASSFSLQQHCKAGKTDVVSCPGDSAGLLLGWADTGVGQ